MQRTILRAIISVGIITTAHAQITTTTGTDPLGVPTSTPVFVFDGNVGDQHNWIDERVGDALGFRGWQQWYQRPLLAKLATPTPIAG